MILFIISQCCVKAVFLFLEAGEAKRKFLQHFIHTHTFCLSLCVCVLVFTFNRETRRTRKSICFSFCRLVSGLLCAQSAYVKCYPSTTKNHKKRESKTRNNNERMYAHKKSSRMTKNITNTFINTV